MKYSSQDIAQSSRNEQTISAPMGQLAQGAMFWQPDYLQPSVWLEHLPALFWLVETIQPSRYATLGVHDGTAHFAVCQAVKRLQLNARCYGVQPHAKLHEQQAADYAAMQEYHSRHYGTISQLVDNPPQQFLEQRFADQLDLVVFDLSLETPGIEALIELAISRCSSRGVLVLPCIERLDTQPRFAEAFARLKQTYPAFSFRHGNGMGIVAVGSAPAATLNSLFDANETSGSQHMLREVFQRLGRSCADAMNSQQTRERAENLERELTHIEGRHTQRTSELEELCKQRGNELQQLHQQHAREKGQLEARVAMLQERLDAGSASPSVDQQGAENAEAEKGAFDKAYQEQQEVLRDVEKQLAQYKEHVSHQKNQAVESEKTIKTLEADKKNLQQSQAALQNRLISSEQELANRASDSSTLLSDATPGVFGYSKPVEIRVKSQPFWCHLKVTAGQKLTVGMSTRQQNVRAGEMKTAVLLFKSYDSQGNFVKKPIEQLSYSDYFEAYFRYLPNTKNKVREIYTFTVPEGVSELHLGLSGFSKRKSERFFVSEFSVHPELADDDQKPQQVDQQLEGRFISAPQPAQLGRLNKPQTIELPQKDPLWHSVPVKPGQALIIEAASEYCNVKGAQNRKAVLLLKSFADDGSEVDAPCGKMAKSGHLKAYFKYLPCTQNQIQELHTFTVPAGVSEIRVGVCGFNKKNDEQIMLRELRVKPRPDKSQPAQFVPPSAQAAEISILGWPEQPPNGKPYVIGIMDEFTTGCFEQDVNLIQPRPDNWYGLAEKYRPEFFFIESAWKGNDGSWQYRVADYANKPGQEVAHICQYAREKGIPTLFWNKEDPVHHQKFMCSAKLVDHIFTTDANMKASYQAKTGNTNVNALPFAAQPALHKPAPLAGRKSRSCFAGSWYGNRHAERGEAMRWLLQAANRHGLDIFDRNHGTGIFPFPEEYQAGIKGSLPYKELCDEYSRYRVFLNVNSVTDSPTMFSRRVFELMACGTPVVSTYAKGIENLFDSDAVWLVNSEEEANEAIYTLMNDDAEWRRRSLAGIREIFAKHTYAHRLNDIFDRLGIETRLPTDPSIALVAEARSQAELEALNDVARKQSYRAFQLGVACPPGLVQLTGSLSDNITLLEPGQKATWLSEQQSERPIAGWLSPRSHYGEHYLRDLANASLYEPDASGWGKALDQDVFAYGGQTLLGGALMRTQEFLQQSIKAHPDERLRRPDVYLADSDQFQASAVVHQQTVGV